MREGEVGKERSSKDKAERHEEKLRVRDAEASGTRPADASSAYQAPSSQSAAMAQRSADRVAPAYPVCTSDIMHSIQVSSTVTSSLKGLSSSVISAAPTCAAFI